MIKAKKTPKGDIFTPEKRSSVMSAIQSKNTKPELLVRSCLHRNGFRFRLHKKDLPGRPDIVLKRFRTVIFVNGCFWHGHGCGKRKYPISNRKYWKEKIKTNRRRDRRNIRSLRKMGWNVIVIWSCWLNTQNKASDTFEKVINALLIIEKKSRSEPQNTPIPFKTPSKTSSISKP